MLGPKFDQTVVKTVSYETTDPTVDSQVVSLQGSGADALLTVATPKFAAQAIKKVAEIGWRPTLHYLTNVSNSAAAVMLPAGGENGKGIMTGAYLKDQTDSQWTDDSGMNELRAFIKQWAPGADLKDTNVVFGYGLAFTLRKMLEQCGDDLSRENIMRQAASLHDFEVPVLIPGIKVNTSPTNFHPVRQMQLSRWTGTSWELFGQVLEGA